MTFTIDRFTVCTDRPAEAAAALQDFGLIQGVHRRHHGQGTEARGYFFDDTQLELMWVADPAALTGPEVAPAGYAGRFAGLAQGSCPFVFTLRGDGNPPFPTVDYAPPYLPRGRAFPVAVGGEDGSEPLVMINPFQHAVGFDPPRHGRFGLDRVTRATVRHPLPLRSPGPSWLEAAGLIAGENGDWRLTLEFAHGRRGHQHDFGPLLPLTLEW